MRWALCLGRRACDLWYRYRHSYIPVPTQGLSTLHTLQFGQTKIACDLFYPLSSLLKYEGFDSKHDIYYIIFYRAITRSHNSLKYIVFSATSKPFLGTVFLAKSRTAAKLLVLDNLALDNTIAAAKPASPSRKATSNAKGQKCQRQSP